MDKFKQYLQQHTNELNNEEPQEMLWDNITKQLPVNKQSSGIYSNLRYLIAASMIGLMVIGGTYFFSRSGKITESPLAKEMVVKQDSIKVNSVNKPSIEKPVIAAATKHSIQKREKFIHQQIQQKQEFNATENKEVAMIESVDKSFASLIRLQKDKINETPLFTENPAYFNDFLSAITSNG